MSGGDFERRLRAAGQASAMEAEAGRQRALLRQVSAGTEGWAVAPGARPPPPLTLCLPQVLGWRVAVAVAWSVLLLPVCTAAFIFLSGIDPLHPVRWISSRCPGAGAGIVGRGVLRAGSCSRGAGEPPARVSAGPQRGGHGRHLLLVIRAGLFRCFVTIGDLALIA